MADATTLIQAKGEQLKEFNRRVRAECERYVTGIDLAIVDGKPCVTLMTEVYDATEEDVAEGRADKVDDPVFSGPPLSASVCKVRARGLDDASKSEDALDQLYGLAEGQLVSIDIVTADDYDWITKGADGKSLATPIYAPVKVTYALATWEIEVEDGDDDDDGETTQEAPEEEEEDEPAAKPRRRKPKSSDETEDPE